MRYALLGRTGLEVSRVVLGTMTFGREADAEAAAAVYGAARDAGVNLVDTADAYADGRSEEILGRLIAGHRDQMLIATKAGTPRPGEVNRRGASRRHLCWSLEESLGRLGTDYVDFFYIHYFDPRTELDESLRALDDLVTAGKVRYPALSNFAAWQVAKALGRCDLKGWLRPACIQPMYNLLKRQAEVELLPMARSEGLGVLVYSPLAAGILSGKYTERFRAEGDARLTWDAKYQGRYGDEAHYRVARAFVGVAGEVGLHPATAALAWCLGHPAVTAVIAGGRSVAQIRPALAAGEADLPPSGRDQLSALVPNPPLATDREEERT